MRCILGLHSRCAAGKMLAVRAGKGSGAAWGECPVVAGRVNGLWGVNMRFAQCEGVCWPGVTPGVRDALRACL